MIAVLFALPQESRDFVALLRARRRVSTPAGPLVCGNLHGAGIVIFHMGVGEPTVRARLRGLAESGWASRFKLVIAAGFAGGLDPVLEPGSLVLGASEGPWNSRARAILGNRAAWGAIATSPSVLETPGEKARFFHETGALAVEMENAAVARFAREAALPLVCLRAITDPADEALPFPGAVGFDLAMQRPRPLALLVWLAARPWKWGAFARFVCHVGLARRSLAAGLAALVEALPSVLSLK